MTTGSEPGSKRALGPRLCPQNTHKTHQDWTGGAATRRNTATGRKQADTAPEAGDVRGAPGQNHPRPKRTHRTMALTHLRTSKQTTKAHSRLRKRQRAAPASRGTASSLAVQRGRASLSPWHPPRLPKTRGKQRKSSGKAQHRSKQSPAARARVPGAPGFSP